MKRCLIWTNIDLYDEETMKETRKFMREENYTDLSDNNVMRVIDDNNNMYIEDERDNLSEKYTGFKGYVVAFAELGLWNGVRVASKVYNDISNILQNTSCDECEWYLGEWNVRFRGVHHDGTNNVLYRYVDTEKRANDIMNKIVCGGMNLKQFKKATKSIRPFVQKVYGIDDKK